MLVAFYPSLFIKGYVFFAQLKITKEKTETHFKHLGLFVIL